ncbi:MAG TPA: ABC transporter substrate-binding protein [Xanthobacteraceae bacterium]|jgi:ABC-type nitrate/sulfonate/bicarbonate transport system substrate-binding protein|nr:ABC transporter substrate-binding protein [Xanthobacteraceae bacterium]
MRYRVTPCVAGLTTGLVAALAAFTAQAAQPYELTILESTPGFFDLPLRNAIADFAPKLNLNVKLITVTGGGGLATEFEGGTGDIAMVAADTPLRLAQANAVPGGVTIVGTNMTNMLYALVAKQGSSYHALADLKGTNVGITGAGAASEVVLKWALKTKAHMDFSAVHLVPLGPPPTILQGIIRGAVAAGTLFSPALDQGINQHEVQMVFDFRDYHYAQNVFMVRTNEVKKDPEPFRLMMQAYNEAVQRMYSDPSYAASTAQKYWGQGTSEDVLKAELEFYMKAEWKETRFTRELYDACKDVLLNSGDFPTNDFPSYESLTQNAPHS